MRSPAPLRAVFATLTLVAVSATAQTAGSGAAAASAPLGAPVGLGSGLGTRNTRPIPPFVGPPAGMKPLPIDMFTS